MLQYDAEKKGRLFLSKGRHPGKIGVKFVSMG